MNIDKTELFMVYNYNASPVCVRTRYDSIIIEGGIGGEPACKPLSFEEIAYINSNSNVFKIGLLWFDEDHAAELNAELRNRDWELVLTNEQIKDILLNPSSEGLKKILGIKNAQYFDRVRGLHTYLMNNGYDISTNVDKLIQSRKDEISKGIMNTKLEIVDTKKISSEDSNKIKELEEKIKALTEQLEKSSAGTVKKNTKPTTEKKGHSSKTE